MKNKISEKDKKDWEDFITKKDKVEDKDNLSKQKTGHKDHMEIDLHGYSLEEANKKISEFIYECHEKKIISINVITGKGLRSKNTEDPYLSLDLGILSGIMRSLIINIASDLKLEVKECHIPLNEVKLMDEAFISSTGIGLVECYWDNWKSDYHYSKRIKKELFNRIKNN